MPRTARSIPGGFCYHVLNRGNARAQVFHKPADYQAFLEILTEATLRIPMRLIAYCLMPNHFHLVVWPRAEGDLSRWMHWAMTTHVARYSRHHGASGHVWQGRFKAFPIQEDDHLRIVIRYVERNPLRGNLVEHAQDWPWSSLTRAALSPALAPGPAPRGPGWLEAVNTPMTEAEAASIATSINRGRPFGTEAWTRQTAEALDLTPSLQPPGRPRSINIGSDKPALP